MAVKYFPLLLTLVVAPSSSPGFEPPWPAPRLKMEICRQCLCLMEMAGFIIDKRR